MKILFLLLPLLIFSQTPRSHHAHQHGSATLSLAFDQTKGRVEFKAAAAGVLGFEHVAKSDKDKKKLAEVVALFEKKINNMIHFDPALDCQFSKDQIQQIADKDQVNHSDFIVNFNISCQKPVLGTQVIFNFTTFTALKDIDVTVLVDNLQKSIELKSKPLTLELK